MLKQGPILEPERAIQVYRDVILERNKAKTPEHKADYEKVAQRLRVIWQYCRGQDTLHEWRLANLQLPASIHA